MASARKMFRLIRGYIDGYSDSNIWTGNKWSILIIPGCSSAAFEQNTYQSVLSRYILFSPRNQKADILVFPQETEMGSSICLSATDLIPDDIKLVLVAYIGSFGPQAALLAMMARWRHSRPRFEWLWKVFYMGRWQRSSACSEEGLRGNRW